MQGSVPLQGAIGMGSATLAEMRVALGVNPSPGGFVGLRRFVGLRVERWGGIARDASNEGPHKILLRTAVLGVVS